MLFSLKYLVLALLLQSACVFHYQAFSYIPSYYFILKQLARTRGHGHYVVEQELNFHAQESSPFKVKEVWRINRKGETRVDVRWNSTDGRLAFLYLRGQKIFRTQEGKLTKARQSVKNIERIFYENNMERLKHLFFSWKAAPSHIKKRDPDNPLKEDFVNLGRKGGVVVYEIGRTDNLVKRTAGKTMSEEKTNSSPSLTESSARKKKASFFPKVWIEQDNFVIRGWRWESGEELVAENYQVYPRRWLLPRERRFPGRKGVCTLY